MAYKMTVRRRLAIASYSAPREGNIYGRVCLDTTRVRAYIAKLRQETGERVTITHVIGKAVANALGRRPDLNGQIVLGRYRPHKTVDIAFLVQIAGGKDLGKVKVCAMEQKSLVEIVREMRQKVEKLRGGKDKQYEKSKSLLRLLPTWVLRPMIYLSGYVSGVLGWNLPAFGLEPYPFGSCIITSVGMLGVDDAYVPPTPFCRVPFYVMIPAIREEAVVVDGEVVIRPMLNLSATLDHRFIDGFQGAEIAAQLRRCFADPEDYFANAEAPARRAPARAGGAIRPALAAT